MASFGYSINDAVALGQIAWNVVRNARAACGEHDELTREVSNLHIVLGRLRLEGGSKAESLINRPENEQEIRGLLKGCEKVLKILDSILQKYMALGEEDRKTKKLWKKIRFGNGEMQDLGQLRAKVTYYTAAISLFLNMLTVGSLGKVELQMTSAGDELKKIRLAVNAITAHLLSDRREGSVLTTYEDDDKAVWKEFRRELVLEGFSSATLHKHKAVIKAYVRELGDRGLLDDPTEATTEEDLNLAAEINRQGGLPQDGPAHSVPLDEEAGRTTEAGSIKDQDNCNLADKDSLLTNIPRDKAPSPTAHSSVNYDVAKGTIPRDHRSQSRYEDLSAIPALNIIGRSRPITEIDEEVASHVVPLKPGNSTRTSTYLLPEQSITGGSLHLRLPLLTAYRINKITRICYRDRCASCDDQGVYAWWSVSSRLRRGLRATAGTPDLDLCRPGAQSNPLSAFERGAVLRKWGWRRVAIVRLDLTSEHLRLGMAFGPRMLEMMRGLSFDQKSQIGNLLRGLSLAESDPNSELQLAQIGFGEKWRGLRGLVDINCLKATDIMVIIQRAPRGSGVSLETLYKEYSQEPPIGLFEQTQLGGIQCVS